MRVVYLIAMLVVAWAGLAHAKDVSVPVSADFAVNWERAEFSHALWEAFLADHVDDAGLVDYRAAEGDVRFREYLYRLANTDPGGLPDSDARKAFWVNAYNALAIHGVVNTLPKDEAAAREYSVIDQPIDGLPPNKGFFKGLQFTVGGKRIALDEIEKRVLLRRQEGLDDNGVGAYAGIAPDAGDPRIHFALVCCARGCPQLRRDAYRAGRIDEQLDEATREFVEDASKSRFDDNSRVWHVSELIGWYAADFSQAGYEPRAADVFKFAARYTEAGRLRISLMDETWRMKPIKYDWRLNILEK